MLEMSAAYFHEEWRVSRPLSAVGVSVVCVLLGTLCSLSFGLLSDVKVLDMNFFDLFDFLVAKLFMPIGSLLMCIFVGWVADERVVRAELTNGGTLSSMSYPVWRLFVRYVAPLCILLIFLNELGLFGFAEATVVSASSL